MGNSHLDMGDPVKNVEEVVKEMETDPWFGDYKHVNIPTCEKVALLKAIYNAYPREEMVVVQSLYPRRDKAMSFPEYNRKVVIKSGKWHVVSQSDPNVTYPIRQKIVSLHQHSGYEPFAKYVHPNKGAKFLYRVSKRDAR